MPATARVPCRACPSGVRGRRRSGKHSVEGDVRRHDPGIPERERLAVKVDSPIGSTVIGGELPADLKVF